MDGPQDPGPPTSPEGMHRDEASQAEVDARLAGYARAERQQRTESTGGSHIAALLEMLVDGQMEQTILLQAILRALQPTPGGTSQAIPQDPESTSSAVGC